eukprot:6489460-Amphidinium_carterae.1
MLLYASQTASPSGQRYLALTRQLPAASPRRNKSNTPANGVIPDAAKCVAVALFCARHSRL